MDLEVAGLGDDEDVAQLSQVLGHAFAFDPKDAARWFQRAGSDEVRVARAPDGDVVGGCVRVPMAQAFGGRFVPMVGLAGVAVRADLRRKGYASEMLRQVLAELWESGVPLSTLYASNQPLYRSLGFEQAGSHFHGTIRPGELRVDESAGVVSLVTEADRPAVEQLYREHALARPGHLDRGPYIWSRLFEPVDGSRVTGALLWNERARLEGYVLYQLRRVEGGLQVLRVTDASSHNQRGWRRIWAHLRDASTLVERIELSTAPTDPLWLLQPHPWMKLRLWENWMLRIVDPAIALEARGYAKGQPERVALRVVDPLLGDSALVVDVEKGRAKVTRGGDPTATVHIRALSAMYTGFLSPYEARAIGLLDAGARSLGALQALFAGPAPWMRDAF